MSRSPILTCTRKDSSIQVFLVSKYKKGTQDKEVYWQAKGVVGNKEVNFEESSTGDSWSRPTFDTWQFQVFKSGFARLLSLENDQGSDGFYCNQKNVFRVTRFSYSNEVWEQSIKNVKLTLDKCKEIDGVEECDILIGSSVGLEWDPEFQPKAFFK